MLCTTACLPTPPNAYIYYSMYSTTEPRSCIWLQLAIIIVSRLCSKSAPFHKLLPGELTEERITQRNLLNAPHIRIIHKVRIDIKEHRHIHCLPSIQPLLLEAKTLDLREIWRHLRRRHTVRSHPNDVIVRPVRRSIECQSRFSRKDSHFALLRHEFPGHDI